VLIKEGKMIQVEKKIIFACIFCLFMGSSLGFSQTQWVGTWVAGQQGTEIGNMPPSPGLDNNTLRQVVHVTIGGSQHKVMTTLQLGLSDSLNQVAGQPQLKGKKQKEYFNEKKAK
jgi:hypothetical protein